MLKAKSVICHEFGKPEDVLYVVNRRVDPPADGEVLVRMLMSPINPSDLIPIRGSYSHRISLPMVPGYEGVGVVEEVGPSVSQNLLGKRVLPLRGDGTWQDFVKVPSEWLVPIPRSINDQTAAQLYINPLTALVICQEVLGLGPKDVLLLNAAGSAIGRIFAQLSMIFGFQFIAVTRNSNDTQELLQLGAAHVIDTSCSSLKESIMELTSGCGVTAAIDSIGGTEGTQLVDCLQPNGNYLAIGLLSGIPIQWQEVSKRTAVNVKIFHLRHWNKQVSPYDWQEKFHQIMNFVKEQRLKITMPEIYFDLLNVREAVVEAESPNRKGKKIFLKMGNEDGSDE